ncbi:MAG: hypothetical protein AB1696_17275 [Planctomycetota bacterium]
MSSQGRSGPRRGNGVWSAPFSFGEKMQRRDGMKRMVTVVGLSAAVALSVSMNAEAQSKKKGKEPELAICKRGNLIFEDDFSGKDLEWSVLSGEWKIEKKALMTRFKSTSSEDCPRIFRPFVGTQNVTFEFRTILPAKQGWMNIGASEKSVSAAYARPMFSPGNHTLSILYKDEKNELITFARSAFTYNKPRWLDVVIEMFGNQYAVTVDGKTLRGDVPPYEPVQRNAFFIGLSNPQGELFVFDDVKVWEALPKDEGEDKDEKGKKKK